MVRHYEKATQSFSSSELQIMMNEDWTTAGDSTFTERMTATFRRVWCALLSWSGSYRMEGKIAVEGHRRIPDYEVNHDESPFSLR